MRGSDAGLGGEGILADPFVGRAPPPPPKRAFAPAAIAAAILSVLPLGSLAAIVIGLRGLRQTKLGTLRGRGLAIASIMLGVLFSVGYAGTGYYFGKAYFDGAKNAEARQERKWDRKQRERDEEERERQRQEEEARAALPPLVTAQPNAPPTVSGPTRVPASGTVPQQTQEQKVGDVTVVELGVKEPNLQQALTRELRTAKADNKEVMVMTTRGGCIPCAGFLSSVADARMQSVLSNVRLVVVGVEVFGEELIGLSYPVDTLAGFFLISADGQPRDGINGGEWDADIAQNIAPVMQPFLRGSYRTRKHPFSRPPQSGTVL